MQRDSLPPRSPSPSGIRLLSFALAFLGVASFYFRQALILCRMPHATTCCMLPGRRGRDLSEAPNNKIDRKIPPRTSFPRDEKTIETLTDDRQRNICMVYFIWYILYSILHIVFYI